MNKLKESLNKEHKGFAVTLEVIATLAMLTTFLTFNLYILRVMDVQRYMNTVMTSTAAEAARWGGVNTRAYSTNVSTTPLLSTAQQQLNMVCPDYGPVITGSPSKILNNGDLITIRISYHLPPIFSTMSVVRGNGNNNYNMYNRTRNMNMQINVHSIMEAGKLL